MRAGDVYLQRYRSSVLVPAAHVAVIASLILTIASGFAATQTLFFRQPDRNLAEEWERERAGRYRLSVDGDSRLLHLTGQFELGITRSLSSILDERPTITGIVLDSEGGYVVEGRGVARLIRERGLDTYVFGVCKSACTTAFIGGRERTIGPNGRLGFHQYSMEVNYPDKLLNPRAEQDRDRLFFAQQGVKPAFLSRVFDKPHDDIWFPELEELLEAGVVKRISLEDRAPRRLDEN